MYAKSTPEGVSIARTQVEPDWVEVTGELPDRKYRNAWVLNGTVIEIDPVKQAEIDLELFKQSRAVAVENIQVTVDGMTFDGDERSQDRMSRAVAVGSDGDTTQWKLSDNTVTTVTHAQLKEALRLAGEEQTKLWIQE